MRRVAATDGAIPFGIESSAQLIWYIRKYNFLENFAFGTNRQPKPLLFFVEVTLLISYPTMPKSRKLEGCWFYKSEDLLTIGDN